jgi:sigma-B regulation protein RsbU (phosphoserine phosphatase)
VLNDELQERISKVEGTAEAVAEAIEEEGQALPLDESSAAQIASASAILDAARKELPGVRVSFSRKERILGRSGAAMQDRFVGMVESEEKLWIRAIVVARGRNDRVLVSASVPCSPELLDSLTSPLGPIQLTPFRPAPSGKVEGAVLELYGRQFIPVPTRQIVSRRRALGPPANWLDRQVNGAATLEAFYDDPNELEVTKVPVLASFSVRPSQLTRLLFASLGAVGDLIVTGLIVIAMLFLLLEVVALITGIVLTRTITHAIADLYEATQHVRKGDFTHRVRLQRRDQLGVLAESFNAMTSSIGELIEEQRKRQRLENELSIAREVQEQLFPQQIPLMQGVELAAVCRPARTVSGDYYDVIRLGPTRLGIAVADISGKGISAALLMASLQAALRSQALQDGFLRTDELVARLNKHLFLNSSDDRYATFFYAVYDTDTRKLAYTNAGHLAPFYVCDGQVIKLEEGGTVVGLFGDCEYTQATVQVAPGSLLVAYSDGLTEPENVYGEQFGTRRLLEEVLRRREELPRRLAEDLLSAAEEWGGSPEQADDMTVLVARLG